MKNIINKYINGSYEISIFNDGTLIRKELDDKKKVEHPTSIDLKVTNFCDLSSFCKWCLVPKTLISTPTGFISIENIEKGQKVYSYDNENKKIVEDIVDELFVRDINEEIYVIEIENGKTIELTSNHEVYVEGKGWILACELNERDEVLDLRM